MRFFILAALCFFVQSSFAQIGDFQGKLVYKLSFEGTSEDEGFNKAMIERTREQIGSIDSVVLYIKDKHFRSELRGTFVIQYFQYVPAEKLIYEHLTKNDFIFIYSPDNEPFPIDQSDFIVTYDSTITTINNLPCRSYSIDSNFGKTTYYYSDSLRANSPILESKYITNFLRTYRKHEFIPVKTRIVTPLLIIEYELINMEYYDVPMTIFQLPEIGKIHKRMQKMMKGTGVKVSRVKQ
jgi:hypothetical protein